MNPQHWPLYATVKPGEEGDDMVWAIVGWHPPAVPGIALEAHMIALGAGEFCGAQQTAVPDMVWASIDDAERFLNTRRRSTANIDRALTPDEADLYEQQEALDDALFLSDVDPDDNDTDIDDDLPPVVEDEPRH